MLKGFSVLLPRPPIGLPGLLATGAPLVLGLVIVFPLLVLMANSFNISQPDQPSAYGTQNWVRAFGDAKTLNSLWNSFALGIARTAIGLVIALGFAWLIARTDMPGSPVFELLFWLTVFLPSLPLTLGWILLLDPSYGLVNSTLQKLPFVQGNLFNVYSFWGIVWVHLASHTVGIMAVLLLPAFRRLDASLEEASRIAGASQLTTIVRVLVPLFAPAVLAVAVLAFVRSLETFEVELLLGIPAGIYVYATRIYDLTRDEPPRFGEATALAFIFLLVLLTLGVLYQWYVRRKTFTTVTGRGYSSNRLPLGRWKWVATGGSLLYFGVTLAGPLILLVSGSFMRRYGYFDIPNPYTLRHWQNLFGDPVFWVSLRNSLVIASAVTLVVIPLYSTVAYAIVRRPSRATLATDIFMWVPWAVPGILLSLGMLWLFLATPLRTLLYGSLFGIIVAMVLKDSPLATLFFKAAYYQIGKELEESSHMSGAGWFHTYLRILVPMLVPTAMTIGLLVFLSSIRDISTPVLLYSADSRPLSLLLLEYSFGRELERATAVGALMSGFVLLVAVAARYLGFRASHDHV
ncbi:MAG: iron ABC transporter permease [Chloroflexi bacterium]|nr:iron ABC transporter permease [Chloroflexota bacterium]